MSAAAPGLICFDLDGTLYYDPKVYLRLIDHFFEDTPYSGWVKALREEVGATLHGLRPLRCGHFAPKQVCHEPVMPEALFDVPSVAALLVDSPEEYLNRQAYTYIGDGWTLVMYLARRIGWDGDAFWLRFSRAREDLLSPDYAPKPDLALCACLHQLRRAGTVLVLCSNAREEYGRPLLRHLNLDSCFDECIFDAEKPHSFPARMKRWETRYGVAARDMLFVGDQGYYDLYAGRQAGACTLLVSPHMTADAQLWDRHLSTQNQLCGALSNWAE